MLHAGVLLFLFLGTVIDAFTVREKPHVFQLVDLSDRPERQDLPAPDLSFPDELPRVELQEIPEQVQPAPIRPEPSPPEPVPEPVAEPARPKPISYEEFLKQNSKPRPRPPTQTRSPRVEPKITIPNLNVRVQVPQVINEERVTLTSAQRSAIATYSDRLRSRIDGSWEKPAQLAGVGLVAEVVFTVSASGLISNVTIAKSSGNAAFDQSILTAFRRLVNGGPTPTGQSHTFRLPFKMTD